MSYNSGGRLVSDGLVLCLDAANRKSFVSGSTVWRDLSNNNNSGSLTNGPTFNSANGGSIVFDGTNDYVNLPHLINVSNPITWNIWFKTTNTDSGFLFSDWSSPSFSFLFRIYFGFFGIGLRNSSQQDISDSTVGRVALLSNNIYNICVTYSQTVGSLNIFSNGSLVQQTGNNVSPANIVNTSNNFSIGLKQDTSTYFVGNVYIASMYNRALSAAEILNNYNVTKKRFGL